MRGQITSWSNISVSGNRGNYSSKTRWKWRQPYTHELLLNSIVLNQVDKSDNKSPFCSFSTVCAAAVMVILCKVFIFSVASSSACECRYLTLLSSHLLLQRARKSFASFNLRFFDLRIDNCNVPHYSTTTQQFEKTRMEKRQNETLSLVMERERSHSKRMEKGSHQTTTSALMNFVRSE